MFVLHGPASQLDYVGETLVLATQSQRQRISDGFPSYELVSLQLHDPDRSARHLYDLS